MNFQVLFLVVLGISVKLFLRHHRIKGEEEFAATCDMCDASEAFGEWWFRNQGVYIGLSPEGRKLLGTYLDAYDEFLYTHSFIGGVEHREYLRRLIYDFPPNHPHGIPGGKKKSVQMDALSFMLRELLS